MSMRAAVAAGFAALLCLGPAAAADASARTPVPVIERATQGPCVAEPERMRREHPQMLSHQRSRTVQLGERGAPVSLQGCVGCHAGAKTGSVAQAETDFCVSCHRYAAVRIDCFDCHATKPQRTAGVKP